MQRRVEQPDRDRQAGHRLEDPLEVGLLHRQQPVERGLPARRTSSAMIISCTCGRRSSPKNMCSVRQRPIPSAPNSRALTASSGVSALALTLSRRKSSAQVEHRLEVLVDLRRDEVDLADVDLSRAAVERDRVQLVDGGVADLRRLRLDVDRDALGAGDARLAHAARDHGRVRRHAAVHGEDPLCRDHPVDVVRRRLPADEDDRLAGAAALRRGVGVEDDAAAGRAGRGVQALRRRLELRVRIDSRVQELVERRRVDAGDGLLARDQALVDHRDGRLQRRGRGALRAARLEEEELAVLDRELDVLHVTVVPLERRHRLDELVERVGQRLLHLLEP